MSNDLYEELIIEILSWLPTKSVLRFRSVSKSLCARISSSDFIRLHTLRAEKRFLIIHRVIRGRDSENMYTIHSQSQLSSYRGITPVEYPFGSWTGVVASCNGILIVCDRLEGLIHLWNPSTRRILTVHELPSWSIGFAHGIGFDPTIDDYKILRIANEDTFVYTIKTRTWRQISPPATRISYVIPFQQCLFNGALHWVIGGWYSHLNHILRFDLSSEAFSIIELPNPSWRSLELTVIKGCLAVLCSKHDRDRETWIWVRDAATASWSLAFKLNEPERQRATLGDLLFTTYYPGGILIFNPQTHDRSRLPRLNRHSGIARMTTCIESLELLDLGTPCVPTTRRTISRNPMCHP